MFNRLFTPKWEHSDPGVRRQALESGAAPAEAMAKAAREDDDPDVRRFAVEHLDDLELLTALAATEPLADIRELAGQRQRTLLAATLQAGPPLDTRLESLRQMQSVELCVFLARQAQLTEIRTFALEHVNETGVLCAVATGDPVAAVRRAALERIEDPQGWETVARETRNKDKQLSRLARERLEAWQQDRADRDSAERLCREMESLTAETLQASDAMRIRRLDTQREQLESAFSPPLMARYRHAREQAAAEIKRLTALQTARRALCTELEDLLGGMTNSDESDTPASGDLHTSLEAIIGRWQAALAPAVDDDPLVQRYTGLVQQVRQAFERRANDHARSLPMQALLQQARSLCQEQAELKEAQVSKLETRWAALAPPADSSQAAGLQHDFNSALQALRERLEQQRKQRTQALENAGQLLAKLESALQAGELEHALSHRDRVHHLLKTAKGVAEHKRLAVQKRLQEMQPQLEELRQWRHWGIGKARQQLCEEIEALDGSARTAEDIAARVRNARGAWKRIDHAEGPARETLWQRFDQACTRAYEPYQRERREQAAQREVHLERKQALCRELDVLERDTDWKQVDWHAADQQVRKARERWRRIGPVPGKARRTLDKNYREVLDRLELHLDKERQRELQRRRALIAEVEKLATAPDLRAADRAVKAAQAKWKPAVQAAPKVEQMLWKAFRSACDAVYKHIRAQRKATDSELQTNLERKTAHCKELEALLEDPDITFRDLARRFATARDEWTKTGTVPRNVQRSIQARYETLEKRFAQRRAQEARATVAAMLQGLQARARLCEQLENEVQAQTMDEASRQALQQETRQAWQQLHALDARHEKILRERLDHAGQALDGDDQARQSLLEALPVNLEKRLELCLQMEITAGIDSPGEFTEARMRFQVSRLADAMHRQFEEPRTPQQQLHDLQMAWHLSGPVPASAQAGLQKRFEHAMSSSGPDTGS